MTAVENLPSDNLSKIESQHRLIGASTVRAMFDGVSDMTLWRWLKDTKLNFPKPIYMQRRRFWREAELIEWINNRPRELAE
ncbi:helix-turn-helix transcriptional regulator [Planktotalea arctica]|uniref:helix-turn-helix transcriptional regulator n=1 Tax=Planktotalea arctica TaxID=1481893 RepID=UPI000A17572F|nr:hypothetical protein [Planktotalea arctica]